MVRAKIYVEGGGPGQLLDTLYRQSWRSYFEAAGLSGRMPKVVRGQSRERTYDLFLTAVRNPRPRELPLLLVDSEAPVEPRQGTWQHLKTLNEKWEAPPGVGDDQAFLMVQVMETWFLADSALLRRYFGPNLREHHLRDRPRLEDISKDTVLTVLKKATAACPKPYSKGKVAAEILAQLDPKTVEARCPHARALLDRLRNL